MGGENGFQRVSGGLLGTVPFFLPQALTDGLLSDPHQRRRRNKCSQGSVSETIENPVRESARERQPQQPPTGDGSLGAISLKGIMFQVEIYSAILSESLASEHLEQRV